MKHFILSITVIIGYLLQLTLAPEFSIFGVQANLLLVVTCAIAFLFGNVEGGLVGLVLGMLFDLYQGRNIGLSAIIFFYLGIFIGGFNKKFFKDNYLVLLVLTVVATIIYETCVYVFYVIAYSQNFMILSLVKNLFIGSIINIIFGVIIYPILLKLNIGFEARRNIFK